MPKVSTRVATGRVSCVPTSVLSDGEVKIDEIGKIIGDI